MNAFRRIFFRLFPNHPKPADTPQGLHLRRVLKYLVTLHILFFFVSLTVIGFLPMISELGLSTWSYSCFLTLREWQVIIYLLLLVVSVVNGIFNVFDFSTVGLLFYIVNLIYLVFALYFCFFAYKSFRMTGGIHGGVPKKKR